MRAVITSSILLVLLAATLVTGAPPDAPENSAFTIDFNLLEAKFSPNGSNTYFSLRPGRFLRFEGYEDGEFHIVEITVLPQTRVIAFDIDGQTLHVRTRIVREREWIDGDLAEVSRNYFARDSNTGNIYYFGEDVNFYENGVLTGHEGSWRAGVDGALPGLAMPSLFLLGAKYFQEVAPGSALDRAKHDEMGIDIIVPAGEFTNCVMVRETTSLEPGAVSTKIYAPGFGLVKDDTLELVEYHD